MRQGDEVEQHEKGSFERTEACECYPPEFHRVMHSHSQVITVFGVNSKRFGFSVASGVQCDILINCAMLSLTKLTKLNLYTDTPVSDLQSSQSVTG